MKLRVLPKDADLETDSEAVHTWVIDDWRHLEKKTRGPKFECGGHPWCVRSNLALLSSELGGKDIDSRLGEYSYSHLETTSTSRPSTSNRAMTRGARNRLTAGTLVYNSAWFCGISTTHRYTLCTVRATSKRAIDIRANMYYSPAANHRFNAEESDWGFTRFAEVRRLFAPQWDNKGRPMIENDAVNVTAYLRIYKDPTGVLWHNFIKLVFCFVRQPFAETYEVTTRRKRPAWLASRTKGLPVISTHSFNPYISRTLFAR